ncbi:similar to Saccharomyces cerevisiae YDR223W CRF1 Transcriptional corepressor involved in repression of ribosomal protein (RP) gene transcription via the TOR signaling pathway [Maudiozyma saulgeensis]|uniref:Similar to Saccharomyces cerevisiae YDR223W CRF1 Transcriptional corepressor involved in repression of ribosomal protein (RP) gene transcription via the TOR signaling pathway n=1 Tax=Maudiozyma saulgeensis TaxID=1789683 RepID=A0A1X7RAZ4_9SACH|nr:similar to Saccharomyces cerevisiae YDR223W CRF1 Transcriptional corepressor involved in repression of ribosomal protein (RP) gene transcription via the TOR signaling pathway [Kazachstania saulgeensis]
MVDNKSPMKMATSKVAGKGVPTMAARPRRFSLIYSSDSSLSDVSDDDKKFNKQNKGKKSSNNSYGKQSKLIQDRSQNNKPSNNAIDDESTESSDYGVIDDDEESSDDDDDDDDSDSEMSSSDDENIDFVKLSAQRKKKVMQAFTKLKRGKTAADIINEKEEKEQLKNAKNENKNSTKPQLNESNKNKSTSLNKVASPKAGSEEDIGEEIQDLKDATNDANIIPNIEDTVDPLHAPTFSDSEESDYDIDQDTYFTAINNDEDSIGEIDTGLETGEDDLPILEAEEQNIVKELQDDDDLSFNGSVHEDGPDPVDSLGPQLITNKYIDDEEDYDEDDDEIMSDFDMPFYEDPKFSNLYYYEDGREPKLSLSTSLPLILNEEKKNRMQKREAKKRERQERIQTRKQLRKNAMTNRSLNIDGDEYSFGAFFHSDDDEEDDMDNKGTGAKGKSLAANIQQNKEKGSTLFGHSDYNSSDSDYDNILLENAHIPSDDESQKSSGLKSGVSSTGKVENTLDLESDMDIDDLDDDGSMTNVFIDIDDLDPDSFYFHYSDDDSSYTHSSSDSTESKNKDSVVETVVYVDDESTDEDDNIPPPEQRKKNIGTKAKEIVSSNTVGLRPPKLGTWETDNKPFSIIDGLSTKSLYTLIQDHQQLHDQQTQKNLVGTSKDGVVATNSDNNSPAEEEITLNELLNMSDMDEEGDANNYNNNETIITSDWYNKPKVPLSAFRNKGVDLYDEDEYMLPSLSRRKVPIGYVGGERTRKKIDKMKELQRKRTEKKRLLKKKRKILKLQREKARVEKEKSILDSHPHDSTTSLEQSMGDSKLQLMDHLQLSDHQLTETPSRKNSLKSVGIDEIHEILGKDDSNLLDDTHEPLGYVNDLNHTDILMPDSDANIIASLTAPVDFDDYGNGSTSLWKQRRQSMAEAAAENLRFTKNGLFSESALADIEGILNNGNPSSAFEFNEVLQ